jgi:hypothetical protein
VVSRGPGASHSIPSVVDGFGKLLLAVLHAANRRYADALVVIRFGDSAEFAKADRKSP